MTWTLTHDGHDLALLEGEQKRSTTLLVDGTVASEDTASFWSASLHEHDGLRVRAQWGPWGSLEHVRLLRSDDGDGSFTDALDFVPPPGSRAARREALRRDHPVRFTLVRVLAAAAQVVIGVLGIGALLTALVKGLLPRIDLPRIDWSWLPSLPSVDAPDWLRYLSPGYWLSKIPWPDLPNLPDLVPDWLADSSTYWLPLVIAVFVALGEIDRRRKQDRERAGDADPVDGGRDETDDQTPPT